MYENEKKKVDSVAHHETEKIEKMTWDDMRIVTLIDTPHNVRLSLSTAEANTLSNTVQLTMTIRYDQA